MEYLIWQIQVEISESPYAINSLRHISVCLVPYLKHPHAASPSTSMMHVLVKQNLAILYQNVSVQNFSFLHMIIITILLITETTSW